MMTDLRLYAEKPEVIIRPAVPHIGLLDEVNVSEVANLGAEAVERALPDLERAVSWQAQLARKIFPKKAWNRGFVLPEELQDGAGGQNHTEG
jgi:hypothetical protein